MPPYGFYGPDYFVGGVFIGAGPWYRGYYGRGGYGYYGRARGYAGATNNNRYYGRAKATTSRLRLPRSSQRRQLWHSNGYSGHNNVTPGVAMAILVIAW